MKEKAVQTGAETKAEGKKKGGPPRGEQITAGTVNKSGSAQKAKACKRRPRQTHLKDEKEEEESNSSRGKTARCKNRFSLSGGRPSKDGKDDHWLVGQADFLKL